MGAYRCNRLEHYAAHVLGGGGVVESGTAFSLGVGTFVSVPLKNVTILLDQQARVTPVGSRVRPRPSFVQSAVRPGLFRHGPGPCRRFAACVPHANSVTRFRGV